MRFKRLNRRYRWVAGCASLFVLGMYVGRLTVDHRWSDGIVVICYVVTCISFFLPLHREYKREEQQFRESMRQLENEMRDR